MFRIALFLACLAAPALALAHNGTVDKYGCHKLRKQDGGYHCHKGPLTGQGFASQPEMLKELHSRERADEAKRKRSPWESRP
jgi:hypothetical protein